MFSVSESLSELSELELLELESLSAPSSLFMEAGFVLGTTTGGGDILTGADEYEGIIGVDNTKSSISEPIIGKLAKVDCVFDDCAGEQLKSNIKYLKYCAGFINILHVIDLGMIMHNDNTS